MVIMEQMASCEWKFNSSDCVFLWLLLAGSACLKSLFMVSEFEGP